jgi:hypothetical protein
MSMRGSSASWAGKPRAGPISRARPDGHKILRG